MAIRTIMGQAGNIGIRGNASTAGVSEVTQASAEATAGTIARAKDGQGDIKSVLIGKKSVSLSVSGYSQSGSQGPHLGDSITVSGVTGIVTSASIEATAEDFTKFSAQGRAIAGGII